MHAHEQSPAPESIDAAAIEQWLRDRLATLLGVDAEVLGRDEAMTRHGLDSRRATQLMADLGAWLGRKISPVLVWEHPTIAALAAHLGPGETTRARSTRVRPPRGSDEPIAVVGVACRFPGGLDREAFWQTLCDGKHVVQQVGDERWSIDRYHDEDPAVPGRAHTRWASLLPQEVVEGFDPLFFNISPREAEDMDPQQRIFLELSWEALLDAGVRPFSLSGANVGVFAGVVWSDYGQLNERNPAEISMHTATGKATNMVSNRVSYTYGFEGPSVTVDTACSSSLVAIHLACQSLRTGDSELAIAGGINLLLDPVTMVGLSKFGGLSRDSRCKAFDASADGFVRGEGGGAVLLKPLSAAVADGDHIYAVVRGTAINNDGASNGLTAPSPGAQRRVLEQAYARSEIDPTEVDYIEAHGTGTSLGDPIEAKALGEVLGGEARPDAHPLRVGSVKTNIGHLEGSAGVAGFIKTVLSIDRGILPPSLHFTTPNPHIPFDELRLRVQDRLEPWPERAPGAPRRAGVSAFGWGGTNCHVVLESGPSQPPLLQWRLAAETAAELGTAVEGFDPDDASARIGSGRERLAITTTEPGEALALAQAGLAGQSRPEIARGTAVERPYLAFVCAPQGGQWRGMARGLMTEEPVFRDVIHQFDAAFVRHGDWSLLDALVRDDADWAWERVHTIQPMIMAVQAGLAALWRSWGIVPDLYIGHSLGEVAAAHLCGALDVDDAARLVIHYSRLQATTDAVGTMAIVGLTSDQLHELLGASLGSVAIAGYNSPDSVVLSGPREALEPIVGGLQAEDRFARFIDVNVAAHSPWFDPILDELRECLSALTPRPAHTPMISTVTGQELAGPELGADYWPRNLREPVLFHQAIAQAIERGVTAMVELNPHPIVTPAIRQTLDHHGYPALVVPSTRRKEHERRVMLEGLASLYVTGHDPSAQPMFAGAPRRDRARVDEPAALVASPLVAVPVSGRSSGDRQARVAHWEAQGTTMSLHDLARTAHEVDSGFEYRCTLLLDEKRIEQLAAEPTAQRPEHSASDDAEPEDRVAGIVEPRRRRKVVFVCPGQGSQWRGMARDLLATQPAFREAFMAVDRLARPYLSRSLQEELLDDDGRLDRIDVVQPLLFAVEVALGELWRAWGIEPDAVVGHSMGEVAATVLAGALPLHDGVRVICTRSALMRRQSGKGAMLAAELPIDEATALIAGHEQQVAIAVSNGPMSTVLSGDGEILEQLRSQLDERGVFCRFVKVDIASHSPQMEPLLGELREQLGSLTPRAATVPIYSTVDRGRIDGTELDAEYWVRNLRQTVHFSTAIEQLLSDGHDLFIELSPHPILLSAVEQCIDAAQDDPDQELGQATDQELAQVMPSMRRKELGSSVMLHGAASLYAQGLPLRWAATHAAGRRRAGIGEQWDRERYWAPRDEGGSTGFVAQGHPLLGRRVSNALDERSHLWLLDLSSSTVPWLADHRVQDSTIVSIAVYVEMLLAALGELGQSQVALRSLRCDHPLVLPERGHRRLQVAVSSASAEASAGSVGTLGLFSQSEDEAKGGAEPGWVPHLRGSVQRSSACTRVLDLEALRAKLGESVEASHFYEGLARRGLDFGPAFQPVERLWRSSRRSSGEALARVVLPRAAASGADRFRIHPVLLDGALQVLLAALGDDERMVLTVGLERLEVAATTPRDAVWSHVRVQADGDGWRADLSIVTDEGEQVARVEGLRLAVVGSAEPEAAAAEVTGPPIVAALRIEAPGAPRRACFESLVRAQVGDVLGLSPERIEPRRPLQAMGLSSLMAVELRNRLGRQLGVRLSATMVWNYPTLEALLPHLESKLPLSLDEGEAEILAPPRPPAEPVPIHRGSSARPAARPSERPLVVPPSAESTSPNPPSEVANDDPRHGSDDPVEDELLEELSRLDSLLATM
ncbi:MAG: acyltransferase domain-containing protein [Myxococcota bacterium]